MRKKEKNDGNNVPDSTEPDGVEGASETVVEPQEVNYEDKWKRSLAELDNMRKRTEREIGHLRKYASEPLILDVIRTMEDMERALDIPDMKKLDMLKGFEMILKELRTTLEKSGVVVIESMGARFDPSLHEAVMQSCTDCAEDDNMVIEELQRGYMLHDRVIRFAKVKVAKYEEVMKNE